MSKTPATKSIPWRQIQKFAESVALGKSATAAYLDARPGVAQSTARVNGSELSKHPRVQMAVASMRQALIEKATEEFILNRDEVLRVHTLAALTPVGQVDESHFLAQEVTYKYATDEDGMPILGPGGSPLVTEKKVKMVSKSDSLKEISKLQGFYKPEKLEITDTSTRDAAIDAFADDPLYKEMLESEARIQAAKMARGGLIDIEPAPPRRTLEEIEEQQRLDDEAEEILLSSQ